MTPTNLAVALCVCAVASVGCATHTVGVHTQPDLDGGRYRTFAVEVAQPSERDAPVAAASGALTDVILGAAEQALGRRGLTLADRSAPADLVIRYRLAVEPKLVAVATTGDTDQCRRTGCTSELETLDHSTLVFDAVDTTRAQVVWRGWAQERGNPLEAGDADGTRQRIRASIQRVFDEFPVDARTR